MSVTETTMGFGAGAPERPGTSPQFLAVAREGASPPVRAEVYAAVGALLKVTITSDDQRLEQDLGITPIDLLSVLLAIETRCRVQLDDGGLEGAVTVGDLVALTEAAVAAKAGQGAIARVAGPDPQ